MPDDPHSRSPAECSPRSLARKIESCIFRNALNEEQRAQKALYLLQAQDRRIAALQKRVAELEDVATNLHEFTLRNSSSASICERKKEVVADFSRSDRSSKTGNYNETEDKIEYNLDDVSSVREDADTTVSGEVSVPRLELSKSSVSNSETDIFSTAIDFVLEKRKCFISNTSFSNEEDTSQKMTEREEKFHEDLCNPDCKSETKVVAVNSKKAIDVNENSNGQTESKEKKVDRGVIVNREVGCENKIKEAGGLVISAGRSEEKISDVSYDKECGSNLPRISSSVPWIRAKHSFRKKLRGYELKTGKGTRELPSGVGGQTFAPFRTIERGSTNRRQGEGEMVDGGKKIVRNANQEQNGYSSLADAQETRPVADKGFDTETKTICTQTPIEAIQMDEKNLYDNKVSTDANHFAPSCVRFKEKQLSVFQCIDEDPAPQCLIEEALARGNERIEQRTKGKISSNKEAEYEAIISGLEAKLARTKEDLEMALRAKPIAKEKYKKLLENAKAETRKANEMLQENIVRICTSVLENFGPRTVDQRRISNYQIKSRRKLKCHERIASGLRKKLHTTMARMNKLKRELAVTRRKLKSKCEEHESISECFDQLKQEMEATETNLNNLISENLSLKRKIDDTRDWLQHTMGKEHHTGHSRDACKNRELANLKKKVEEDSATITHLKNKLVRLESANANKGFLLNSYKGQLTELTKEKNQLVSKMNSLENEVSNVRNSNSQLKAKISVLNNEKDKLLSDNEKSKADIKGKMETRCAKKRGETAQQEIEVVKAKYEETIKSTKMKLLVTKTQNIEYLNAIKEFLRKLYELQGDRETEKFSNENEASERETQETICNILNMTPDELSGFINGKTKNSINLWMVELNRIIATNQFSKDLSKFLLKKVTKKTKT
ncbi:uncharacterized protein [Bombus fervidus]|uniref:uncharacterized protein n=1 Tax=Bombus fervidus TaxID=203811 RepID=UPI003AB872EF